MLEVKDLCTYFYNCDSTIKAVDNISFKLQKKEIVGLLGESGSGKSTVGLSILRLIASPGKIISGKIFLHNTDILKLNKEEMTKIRGRKISMIFQDPFSSLNPVLTVGEQICETILLHQKLNRKEAKEKTISLLELVKIDPLRINNYPHQFSGGMNQRVMIAIALSCEPEFLIADEPTTALDTRTQEEILALIHKLQKQLGFGMLFITHNFKIAEKICDRFLIMQNGSIIEEGTSVFTKPTHSYTQKLISYVKALYG